MTQLLHSLDTELSTVVDKAGKSLVQIHNGRSSAGAGTILHADGLIVTNAHVVRQKRPKITLWNGTSLQGRLLAIDKKADLAALSIEASDLPVLEAANGSKILAGQWVIALGHPWGIRSAATAGMIIAVGKPLENLPYPGKLIQVGLRLRPGHSGGPMVDGYGRLIGINTMISGPEVGLAIPIQTVKRFLKHSLGSQPPASSD